MLPQEPCLSINAGRITRAYNRLWQGFVVATTGVLALAGALWITFTLIDWLGDKYDLNIGHAITSVWILPLILLALGARGVSKHRVHLRDDYSVEATRLYNKLNRDHKALAKPVVEKIYVLERAGEEVECSKRIKMLRELKKRERTVTTRDDSDLVSLDAYLNDESLRPLDSVRSVV